MELDETIKTRRSIRSFRKDEIPDTLLERIIESGTHAPSSHNTQPWEFIIIKDKETIKNLSKTHQWSGHILDAPVLIIACGNLKKRDHLFPCMLSVALAVQNMLLKIHELGLGTCWTYIHNPDEPGAERYVKETLHLPDNIRPLCMLPIGYPAYTPKAKKNRDQQSITHSETYSETQ